jgi:hypothetical protein
MKGRLISRSKGIATTLFILYPISSVPWIIGGMMRRKKWAFFLWAIFMGLLGILYPPTGDLYRYTLDYYTYLEFDWAEFVASLDDKFDYLLPILSFSLGKLGLDFDISRFLYNFFAYYLLGRLYLDVCSRNEYLNDKRIAFYILFFFIPIYFSLFLTRFYFSIVVFLYGAYQIAFCKKNIGWLFVLLSVFNHLTFLSCALFLFCYTLFKISRMGMVVIVLIVLIFASTDISLWALSFLPLDIGNHYAIYIDGYWAGEYLDDHSWKYQLQKYTNNFIGYITIFIYLVFYNKGTKKQSALVNALIFLTFLTVPFILLRERFITLITLCIKIYFITVYDGTVAMRRSLTLLFIVAMLSNTMALWSSRRQIGISELPCIFYSSSIQILLHNYDKKWIDKNVTENGNISINNIE